MSNSLQPHGLQHTRLPCPSLSLRVYPNSVHWVNDAIQAFHPLSPPSPLSSIFLSIKVFSNELALRIRWPKYWSFSISSSNEYSVLISLRIDWFDLLAIQGTLKSLLQHHSLKASILGHSAFYGPTHICTWLLQKQQLWLDGSFVSQVMFLLFNMLSRFVIAFLTRSKHLLISWLQSPSAVIF